MSKRRPRSDAWIYLQDQCPRIGSGTRGVQLISRGRKWVYFRETATKVQGNLPLRDWDRLTSGRG